MNDLKIIKQNFIEVFSNWKYLIFGIIISIIFGIFIYISTNFRLLIGNYGMTFAVIEIILMILIILFFGIFFPASVYKFVKTSSFSAKENSSSIIGTFIGILVTGCPSCSIVIASYIGLGGFLALLPWGGMSLKVISVILLLYANYSILKNLNVCKIKPKRNKIITKKNKK